MSDAPVVGRIEFAPFGNLTPEARPGDWKILAEAQNKRIEALERGLRQFRDKLADESDVTDGSDRPRPNTAMRFLTELETLFPELEK